MLNKSIHKGKFFSGKVIKKKKKREEGFLVRRMQQQHLSAQISAQAPLSRAQVPLIGLEVTKD